MISSFLTESLPRNTWTRVKIIQNNEFDSVMYRIFINNREVFSKENTDAREFHNVHAYSGSKYHHPARAMMKSLQIVTPIPAEEDLGLTQLTQDIPVLFPSWKVGFSILPGSPGPILSMGVRKVMSKHFGNPIPGIYILPGSTVLRIEYDIGYDGFFDTDPLPVNQWTNIDIEHVEEGNEYSLGYENSI